MISSEEAIALLNKWKGGSTRLFIHSSISGVRCWFVGKVEHSSRAELHFRIDGIDTKDFLFVVVCSDARFSILDVKESTSLFFSPRRDFRDFGTILEIALPGRTRGEIEAGVIVTEVFADSS
jgi:hypothetical protein